MARPLKAHPDQHCHRRTFGEGKRKANVVGYYDKMPKRGFQFLETNNNANERKDEAS